MNRFSVVESVRHLIGQYRSFIRSSYKLADLHLREQFERHVNQADVLVKGPYVTLAQEFEQGGTLASVLESGCGHGDLARLRWPFGAAPLYAHQEASLRAAEGGRNVIVKTGTGSGKTEAFLLPVLSGVLAMRERGVQGTKAILLYPMNALANDQLLRLRELIRNTGAGVTFALYTGDSQTVAAALGEPVAGNEITQREAIRRAPPDILLTNYKQLEFLLVRNADRALFTPALRYVVLDEIHSYRGALATELACLLRRLKARCSLSAGELRAIGTSATVSQDAGGDEALAHFAQALFDEPFEARDVIGERYRARPPAPAQYDPPLAAVSEQELSLFTHGDEPAIVRFAERLCGRKAPASGSAHGRLQALLSGNRIVEWLEANAAMPRSLDEVAVELRAHSNAPPEIADEALVRLVEAYLLVGSFGDDAQPPLLRPKLHTFFHGVYDVGLCMNPACRTLSTDGTDRCHCGAAVRPAVLCRTCGQDFVKVRFDPDHPTLTVANDDFLSDDETAYITPELVGERAEDTEDEGEETQEEPRPTRQQRTSAVRRRLLRQWTDHVRGRVFETKPDDVPAENLSFQHVLRGRGSSCPVCNSRYPRGDVLTLLRTGVASSVSVLGTHHLDRVPEEERKLLVFADNRQDAAHQAGYMSDRHRQFALRHSIEAAVKEAGASGIALQDLPQRVLEIFQGIGLAKRNLTRDEEKYWRHTLEYEVAGEFCRATHQRIALENLALVEVQYEFLDKLVADARFVELCRRAGLTPEKGATLVRAMLDFMRRRRAVSFDFYQRFLDPKKVPWSYLTAEPYNLSVGEHERGATFFMFDRPEALRSKAVSGIKFDPLVKDTARGAAGGIAKLVCDKAGLGPVVGEEWVRGVFALLQREEYEIVQTAQGWPAAVQRHLAGERPLQVARRVVRLAAAKSGWRCRRCSIWRPYRFDVCLASTGCSGSGEDIQPSMLDRDNYYVDLYTADRPRRLRSLEHTAQIDQELRAKREQDFKQGRVETLVCSPTLELGVDIGSLYSVLMRNAPHGPANYVQRAGRAGRRLRIGFVTTFCSMGAHDRHCFEDPAWLVRGEFRPPVVRLSNDRIVARHVRSFALEELNQDFSWLMGDLLEDPQDPTTLKNDLYAPLLEVLRVRSEEIGRKALTVFRGRETETTVTSFPDELARTIAAWHELVKRLHREYHEFAQIVRTRESDQKARARQRAYRELTTDREKAFVLSYLSETGVLPSYQFPTDTFSLDPGVGDTPTLRRPAWIALFEFAPGNMVYANGHKLKSIRAFFEGSRRGGPGEQGAERSGQVERFSFCTECGFASRRIANTCRCGRPISNQAEVALIDSFEAEENTQITSSEDSRQRMNFRREEHLLDQEGGEATIFPYELASLEFRTKAGLLVTNWGRQSRRGGVAEQFDLCPNCGRHRPAGLTGSKEERWIESHRGICTGEPRPFILGYEFSADVLVFPVPAAVAPTEREDAKAFCRTLGKALVLGAQEMLEIEADEIAYFHHPDGAGGWTLTFYETAPGGAGYLEQLAGNLRAWAVAAQERLYNHDCERACYRCLKSARNQIDHALLDKELVRSMLFQLSEAESTGQRRAGRAGESRGLAAEWVQATAATQPTSDTEIERALADAIRTAGRLPEPAAQLVIPDEMGRRLTVPDFAYPERKIAIYCDGFAYHGDRDTLESDTRKRNLLQSQGWAVLTFWGRQILRNPAACEAQIWRCFQHRREGSQRRAA